MKKLLREFAQEWRWCADRGERVTLVLAVLAHPVYVLTLVPPTLIVFIVSLPMGLEQASHNASEAWSRLT